MKTSINVVLDKSGSMAPLQLDTIGGFNLFLKEQKAEPGEATFTLAQFSSGYDLIHDAVPIAKVPDLDAETYSPGGSTALYDAVGRTIHATGARIAAMPAAERPERVLFVIITDGMENASQEFSAERVREMIAHQRDVYKWDFVFMGANLSAMNNAAAIGIAAANAHQYQESKTGAHEFYVGLSRGVSSYRSGGTSDELVSKVKI